MPSRPSRPRLEDVAARAGVSTASVSLVLRGRPGPSAATREAVLEAARDLGYRADRTASLLAVTARSCSVSRWTFAAASTPSSSRTSRPLPTSAATTSSSAP